MLIVEIVSEYEVDVEALAESHDYLRQERETDEDLVLRLIENKTIEPEELGDPNHTNITAV